MRVITRAELENERHARYVREKREKELALRDPAQTADGALIIAIRDIAGRERGQGATGGKAQMPDGMTRYLAPWGLGMERERNFRT